jgi:hypothetical protein
MINYFAVALLVLDAIPLWKVCQANRQTTLTHALAWTAAAWLAWTWVAVQSVADYSSWWARYQALTLTGCAAIAVLGARRPGMAAWNFVVAGLLAVLSLPFAQTLLTGQPHLEWYNMAFVGAVIAVGVLNYLPTRMAPAAVSLGLGTAIESITLWKQLAGVPMRDLHGLACLTVAATPWLASMALLRRRRPVSEFDRRWFAFRDSYGLVWGQRLREQFNAACRNAGWPAVLWWTGLRHLPGHRRLDSVEQEEMIAALASLMKRFTRQA